MTELHLQTVPPYPITIGQGLLPTVGRRVRAVCPVARRAVVVTDDTVRALYGDAVCQSLDAAQLAHTVFSVPPGEGSKSLPVLDRLLDALAAAELCRGDVLLALGGGVVGDLCGLAAALYLRGVAFVQVPTTLLAAIDSSVGGKTAVNLPQGKNLVGAFWQPAAVLCDTDTFDTLSPQVLRDGVAEGIKYGLLQDPALLAQFTQGSIAPDAREALVARCVQIKRDFVLGDTRDRGRRQMLNLGHTFGHAVERCSDFAVSHGHAVAIGMAMMTRAAQHFGHADPGVLPALLAALRAHHLPHNTDFDAHALCAAALHDKKRNADTIHLVVPEQIGRCCLLPLPVDKLYDWICVGLEE